MDFFISFFGNFWIFGRTRFSGMDLGLRRAEEGSVDFGAFGTRSSPGDRRKSQESILELFRTPRGIARKGQKKSQEQESATDFT